MRSWSFSDSEIDAKSHRLGTEGDSAAKVERRKFGQFFRRPVAKVFRSRRGHQNDEPGQRGSAHGDSGHDEDLLLGVEADVDVARHDDGGLHGTCKQSDPDAGPARGDMCFAAVVHLFPNGDR